MRLNLDTISNDEAQLEMTPMIDVTFLLLIFFMCTIKFKSLEGKLGAYLPKGAGQERLDEPPSTPISLAIQVDSSGSRVSVKHPSRPWDGKGEYALVGRQISFGLIRSTYADTPAGRAALAQHLRALQAADPERPLAIESTPETVQSDVVKALDLCSLAGFTDVTFEAQ